MKVAILGGGLSAAFSWRACLDSGITPDVYADRLFVPPGGFVYVHWLPKSVNNRSLWEKIKVVAHGSERTYTSKMWGTGKYIPSSFPAEPMETRGVNPLTAAKVLWGGKALVLPRLQLGKLQNDQLARLVKSYDIVIQTFSLRNMPLEYHTPIWVIPHKCSTNAVLYNGSYDSIEGDGDDDDETSFWTRKSLLFNFLSYEFPPVLMDDKSYIAEKFGKGLGKTAKLWYAPEIPPVEISDKTRIEEYCDGNILYVGRWATGRRKFLSHEAYNRVRSFLTERGHKSA